MGWFKRLFGGGGLSNPEKGAQVAGPDSKSTDSGLVLTDERAMSISAVCNLKNSVYTLHLLVASKFPK